MWTHGTPTRITRQRDLVRLTRMELAALVRVSRQTIWAIERERSIPSVTLAIAIARALETTVEELFGADDLR